MTRLLPSEMPICQMIRPGRGKMALAAGLLALLSFSGCLYDEVSMDFANGVNVYNFLSKTSPVQIIGFEDGIPPTIYHVLIDGVPLSAYPGSGRGGVPVRRGDAGRILALTYHWSERHAIQFMHESTQYTMPLSDRQLRHLFGAPIKVDRRSKPK